MKRESFALTRPDRFELYACISAHTVIRLDGDNHMLPISAHGVNAYSQILLPLECACKHGDRIRGVPHARVQPLR
eukprot:493993-Amphidinium_carterae.1